MSASDTVLAGPRLRLPLIGGSPVGFQIQVLAALFFIALLGLVFFILMDNRAQTQSNAEAAAAGEMRMLALRMSRAAQGTLDGSPGAIGELNEARTRFDQLLGFVSGSGAPGSGTRRSALETMRKHWDKSSKSAQLLIAQQQHAAELSTDIQAVLRAREVAADLNRDSAALERAVETLAQAIDREADERPGLKGIVAVLGSVALLALVLMVKVYNDDAAARSREAERLRREAEAANAATQDAILRLMNEMAHLAEGDLTARATVTADITGAIADAVNYAVEELAVLVKRLDDAAGRVAEATDKAALTSKDLLAASEVQSREIRRANAQVLTMAGSMSDASGKAQASAQVARQSLDAARKGAGAVADSIEGMNEIRGQIQETSKRIKRLGESSQEIGEIVELISDITEQTNVLALNAAIQAAAAGEAGRGFSVVAEEVQRLAERSSGATRQIAAIVKTIQTDTHDAVAAMEHATQDVVKGAGLSDAAGQALDEISTVSGNLAQLIEGISADTQAQAEIARQVAAAMQEILRITELTSAGTQETAGSIQQLANLAVELKSSVAGFKV